MTISLMYFHVDDQLSYRLQLFAGPELGRDTADLVTGAASLPVELREQ
jgi:hypothetical protein